MAPIYMLAAIKGTDLYERLKRENRLLDASGETNEVNAMALNFKPEMDPETLIRGYRRVTATLYDPTLENYFKRCQTLLEHLKPVTHPVETEEQERTVSGPDGRTPATVLDTTSCLREVHRQSHEEPPPYAPGGDSLSRFGLPL